MVYAARGLVVAAGCLIEDAHVSVVLDKCCPHPCTKILEKLVSQAQVPRKKHTKMLYMKEPWVLVEMGMVVETEQEHRAELLAGSVWALREVKKEHFEGLTYMLEGVLEGVHSYIE